MISQLGSYIQFFFICDLTVGVEMCCHYGNIHFEIKSTQRKGSTYRDNNCGENKNIETVRCHASATIRVWFLFTLPTTETLFILISISPPTAAHSHLSLTLTGREDTTLCSSGMISARQKLLWDTCPALITLALLYMSLPGTFTD